MRMSSAHRAVLTFFVVAAMTVPVAAMATTYWSTLDFTTTLTGAYRSYVGSNMNITISNAWSTPVHSTNKTFRVELHRKKVIGYDYIGYSNFPRDGSKTATWTNVGSGTYRFYFSKANDLCRVRSNSVKMFN